jgi:hypothetical protein
MDEVPVIPTVPPPLRKTADKIHTPTLQQVLDSLDDFKKKGNFFFEFIYVFRTTHSSSSNDTYSNKTRHN